MYQFHDYMLLSFSRPSTAAFTLSVLIACWSLPTEYKEKSYELGLESCMNILLDHPYRVVSPRLIH